MLCTLVAWYANNVIYQSCWNTHPPTPFSHQCAERRQNFGPLETEAEKGWKMHKRKTLYVNHTPFPSLRQLGSDWTQGVQIILETPGKVKSGLSCDSRWTEIVITKGLHLFLVSPLLPSSSASQWTQNISSISNLCFFVCFFVNIYLFGCTQSQLQHAGFLIFFVACGIFSWGMWGPCYCLVPKSCPALWDPVDCSTPVLPVSYYLPEFAQVHVHWIGDAIQPSHPLVPWPRIKPGPLAMGALGVLATRLPEEVPIPMIGVVPIGQALGVGSRGNWTMILWSCLLKPSGRKKKKTDNLIQREQ